MDPVGNKAVYDPFRKQNIGRRTGKLISFKTGPISSVEDFFSDSESEVTLNITRQTPVNVTSSRNEKSSLNVAKELSDVAPPEAEIRNQVSKVQNMKVAGVIDPFPRSRYGRRTGKDVFAGKQKLIQSNGIGDYSDFFSDNDASYSLNPTPKQSPTLDSSFSSAKESDSREPDSQEVDTRKKRKSQTKPLAKRSSRSRRESNTLDEKENNVLPISHEENKNNTLSQITDERENIPLPLSHEKNENNISSSNHEDVENVLPDICEDLNVSNNSLSKSSSHHQCDMSVCVKEPETVHAHMLRSTSRKKSAQIMLDHLESEVSDTRPSLTEASQSNSHAKNEEEDDQVFKLGRQTTSGADLLCGETEAKNKDALPSVESETKSEDEGNDKPNCKEHVKENVETESNRNTELRNTISSCVSSEFKAPLSERIEFRKHEVMENHSITNEIVCEDPPPVTQHQESKQKSVKPSSPNGTKNHQIGGEHSITYEIVSEDPLPVTQHQESKQKSVKPLTPKGTKKTASTLDFGGDIAGSVSQAEKIPGEQFFGIRKRLTFSRAFQNTSVADQKQMPNMQTGPEKEMSENNDNLDDFVIVDCEEIVTSLVEIDRSKLENKSKKEQKSKSSTRRSAGRNKRKSKSSSPADNNEIFAAKAVAQEPSFIDEKFTKTARQNKSNRKSSPPRDYNLSYTSEEVEQESSALDEVSSQSARQNRSKRKNSPPCADRQNRSLEDVHQETSLVDEVSIKTARQNKSKRENISPGDYDQSNTSEDVEQESSALDEVSSQSAHQNKSKRKNSPPCDDRQNRSLEDVHQETSLVDEVSIKTGRQNKSKRENISPGDYDQSNTSEDVEQESYALDEVSSQSARQNKSKRKDSPPCDDRQNRSLEDVHQETSVLNEGNRKTAHQIKRKSSSLIDIKQSQTVQNVIQEQSEKGRNSQNIEAQDNKRKSKLIRNDNDRDTSGLNENQMKMMDENRFSTKSKKGKMEEAEDEENTASLQKVSNLVKNGPNKQKKERKKKNNKQTRARKKTDEIISLSSDEIKSPPHINQVRAEDISPRAQSPNIESKKDNAKATDRVDEDSKLSSTHVENPGEDKDDTLINRKDVFTSSSDCLTLASQCLQDGSDDKQEKTEENTDISEESSQQSNKRQRRQTQLVQYPFTGKKRSSNSREISSFQQPEESNPLGIPRRQSEKLSIQRSPDRQIKLSKPSTLRRKTPRSKEKTEVADQSTPVQLHPLAMLPKVTPKSGVSFRSRSSCFAFQSHVNDNTSDPTEEEDSVSYPAEIGEHPSDATKVAEDFKVPVDRTPVSSKPKRTSRSSKKTLRKRAIMNSIKQLKKIEAEKKSISDSINEHESLLSPGESSTILPSPSSTPVHYLETTTSHRRSSIFQIPDLSNKIVPPEESEDGLRRSKRTRVKRLNPSRGETIVYRRDSSGFGLIVDTVEPSSGAIQVFKKEKEMLRKKTKRKFAMKTVPAKMKRLSTHRTVPEDLTESTEIPVVNPDTNETVNLELIARSSEATWYGPDLDPVTPMDPVAVSLLLSQPSFGTGELHMRPFCEKEQQLAIQTLIYSVMSGKISVTVNGVYFVVQTGDDFFVPRGSSYRLQNLRKDIAKIKFVNLKDDVNDITCSVPQ